MGDASDPQNPNFALSGFDAALWDKINAVVRQIFSRKVAKVFRNERKDF